MENNEQRDVEDLNIQGLLDNYLRLRNHNSDPTIKNQHLNEDFLTAFVENRLAEREKAPIIDHLVSCSFCRRITAELIRLDLALFSEEAPVSAISAEPAKVADVLNGLISRLFGGNENAVFAHEEKEKVSDAEKFNN